MTDEKIEKNENDEGLRENEKNKQLSIDRTNNDLH